MRVRLPEALRRWRDTFSDPRDEERVSAALNAEFHDGYATARRREDEQREKVASEADEYLRGERGWLEDPDSWLPIYGGPKDGELAPPVLCCCSRCSESGFACNTWPVRAKPVLDAPGEYELVYLWNERSLADSPGAL